LHPLGEPLAVEPATLSLGGAWFAWAVPAILAGAGGAAVEPVGPGGIAMVVLDSVVGIVATVAWWDRADQTG
jgi:hypothetical protein